jgi:signal transduction histidine kinase
MSRSIFNRLMITYILLIILVTGSLALIMSIGFNRYVFTEKNKALSAAALKAETLINDNYNGKLPKDQLQSSIDNLGFLNDSTIYAIKVDKKTLSNPSIQSLTQELSEDYLLQDLQDILDGKNIYRKKQFSQVLDADVVFYGTPLRINHKIAGAILVFSPLSPISSNLARINAIIFVIALAAIILSFFLVSITSARISRPIKEMEQLARNMANGEAGQELDVHTGDEIEQLAVSFNHMKRQVETTEHMRREFIANVSHELRTPLTSINGFIQGMLDGLIQPEKYPHYLKIIQDETQRLMRLTGDILELAKIQSGNIHLNKRSIPARDLLDKVIAAFDLPAEGKNLTISIDCDPQLCLWADPDRLRQILHNIIGNAIRYIGDGGTINISVQKQAGDSVITITDNGKGISPGDLPYVFERFYRDDKSRQGHTGTGLGLSIVKNLVELHGGTIRAESPAGNGTSFIFNLPGAR